MEIEVRDYWGLIVARTEDTTGFKTNYWFKEIRDRLILVAEVIQFENKRIYVEDHEMMVPPALEKHLLETWESVEVAY